MRKKNLSFMTIFLLTASLIGGCSCSKKDEENVNSLVIKVGDKEYSAEELYNELITNGEGASDAFNKVLRLVVESSVETTENVKAAADLAVESLEEEAKTNATNNGTKKEDELKKLLEDKGYSSVDEMRADIIYNQKLTRITEGYWEANKDKYYNEYVENRLPYLIRHVLVKIDDSTNANKIANNVAVGQNDSKKLYDVIKRFESGDKFAYVANQESEDTGSTATGGAYYMDNTYSVNGFVDEFVYGTYAFDAFTTKNVVEGEVTSYTYGKVNDKYSKLEGLTDTETFNEYYANGFNFVDMSIVNALGEMYNLTNNSNRDYFTINAYNETVDGDSVEYTSATNLNSTENYYARSIIFNRAFNKPGVSVIGYNTEQEAIDAGARNYIELKLSATESKYILTDENSNPIYFVAAKGSNNELWVHFMTINVSALDDLENAKKFFTLNPVDDDNYTSYVELMNIAGTKKNANTLTNTLESYVKSYATSGVGGNEGDNNLLTFDMVKYYMDKNEITFKNDEFKKAVERYIDANRNLIATKYLNSLTEDWSKHTNKLKMSISNFVTNGIKPYECGVYVDSDITERLNPYEALSTSENLCRYVYGKGYQVQLLYYYETTAATATNDSFQKVGTSTSNTIWFDDESGYTQYVTIGEEGSDHIVLPTPKVNANYVFRGWYTDKNLTQPVESIDLSTTSIDNHTIFFAKVVQKADTNINYQYVYANGTAVNSDVVRNIENSNATAHRYNPEGNNTVTLSLDQIVSSNVTALKFLDSSNEEIDSLPITIEDYGATYNIKVVVAPKATTLNFIYVNAAGNDMTVTVEEAPTNTITYDPVLTDHSISFTADDFTFTDHVAVGFKFAREENFENASATFNLAETDMGMTIKVYVIVEVEA